MTLMLTLALRRAALAVVDRHGELHGARLLRRGPRCLWRVALVASDPAAGRPRRSAGRRPDPARRPRRLPCGRLPPCTGRRPRCTVGGRLAGARLGVTVVRRWSRHRRRRRGPRVPARARVEADPELKPPLSSSNVSGERTRPEAAGVASLRSAIVMFQLSPHADEEPVRAPPGDPDAKQRDSSRRLEPARRNRPRRTLRAGP